MAGATDLHTGAENGALIVIFTNRAIAKSGKSHYAGAITISAYLDALTVGIEEVDLNFLISFLQCGPLVNALVMQPGELIGKLQSNIVQTPWTEVAKKQINTRKKAMLQPSQQSRRVSAQYFTAVRLSASQQLFDWGVIRKPHKAGKTIIC